MSEPTFQPTPDIDKRWFLVAYAQGRYDEIAAEFIKLFKHYNEFNYSSYAAEDARRVDDLVSIFFYILTQEDFTVPPKFAATLANVNHIIANVVAASSYGTTDGPTQHIMRQKNNLFKLLALHTCRSNIELDPDILFKANKFLAAIWWLNYQTSPAGASTAILQERFENHIKNPPVKDFSLMDLRSAPMYFQATYYTEDCADRPIKQMLNREFKKLLDKGPKITSRPRKGSIAIVTGRWQPTTAVYKSIYPCVAALKDAGYDLTLVQYGTQFNKTDCSLFGGTRKVTLTDDRHGLKLKEIKNNNFELAYFPDIGMNEESVALSNMRVAPIMVTGYGHPVSTYGSEVDYFIGGAEVEDLSCAEDNYSERLVVIPGMGCAPVHPKYTRTNPEPDPEVFWINCCWTAAKINWPMLKVLKEIQKHAEFQLKVKVGYQFFPSWTAGRYNNLIPFCRDITKLLGTNVRIFKDIPYHEYLEKLEAGRFSIDSFPFGGFNTVLDNLYVGCPVVSIQGSRWFNRASSALIRRVGLDQLVTVSRGQCRKVATSLIQQPEYLETLRSQLTIERVEKTLINTCDPGGFVKAIDYLVANHDPADKSKEPIVI